MAGIIIITPLLGSLVAQQLGLNDQEVVGSTPGWVAIK